MPRSSAKLSLIDEYFCCWKDHSITCIRRIFSLEAEYVVRPRGKTFLGREQIESYWKRNSRRQKDLRLTWSSLDEDDQEGSAIFHCCFFDEEEKRFCQVLGCIVFGFESDTASSGNSRRINKIDEDYIKIDRLPGNNAPLIWRT